MEELGEALQGKDTICAAGPVNKIDGDLVTTTGLFVDGIDENVGIEAIA